MLGGSPPLRRRGAAAAACAHTQPSTLSTPPSPPPKKKNSTKIEPPPRQFKILAYRELEDLPGAKLLNPTRRVTAVDLTLDTATILVRSVCVCVVLCMWCCVCVCGVVCVCVCVCGVLKGSLKKLNCAHCLPAFTPTAAAACLIMRSHTHTRTKQHQGPSYPTKKPGAIQIVYTTAAYYTGGKAYPFGLTLRVRAGDTLLQTVRNALISTAPPANVTDTYVDPTYTNMVRFFLGVCFVFCVLLQ